MLTTLLKEAQETCDDMATLYFHPGGIFANSIVRNQEITNLITDLNIDLGNGRRFLVFNKQTNKLQRYDGAQYTEDETMHSGDFNNNDVTIKPFAAPELDTLSMAHNQAQLAKLENVNSKLQNVLQQRLNNRYRGGVEHENSDDELKFIDELRSILLELNQSYPVSNLNEYLDKLRARNIALTKQSEELLQIEKEIGDQLRKYNVDLNEKELTVYEREVEVRDGGNENTKEAVFQAKRKELEELKRKLELEREV